MATTFSRPPAAIEIGCSCELESVSIRAVLERVAAGRLRVPRFRRGFVWNAADTAALMDSIWRGLPIGIVVLWRTAVRLRHASALGSGAGLPPAGSEHDYVLDGRQRLEALCRVLAAGEPPADETRRFDCYLDRAAGEAADRIVSLERKDVVAGRHVGLRAAFASEADPEGLRAAFERATIPLQVVRTESSEAVALLIERLNRAGVGAENFDLIGAWTWHDAQARGVA